MNKNIIKTILVGIIGLSLITSCSNDIEPLPTTEESTPTVTTSSPEEQPAVSQSSSTTIPPTKEEPSLPPMKTYTNDAMGFSVDYPETWKVDDRYSGSVGILHPALIVQYHVVIYDEQWQRNFDVSTAEEQVNFAISMNMGYGFELLQKPTNTNFDGLPACEAGWISDGKVYRHLAIKKETSFLVVEGILYDTIYELELNAMFDSFKIIN